MKYDVPLCDIDYGKEEEEAVLRVLKSKWLSMGPETEKFEEEFKRFLGVKYAIACSSGTAALHLALLAIGTSRDDLVMQPAVNFVAAANMTIACNARPYFIDIKDLKNPTISRHELQKHLEQNSKLKPKAVICMHYGGYPCDVDEIRELCKEHGVFLIEDACHAIGAESRAGNMLGCVGDVGCFSFYSNKNLVTGEGGMVVTDSEDLSKIIRDLRSNGMTSLSWNRYQGRSGGYDVVRHGFSYRFDDLRAALGRIQLKRLVESNRKREDLTHLYWSSLEVLENNGWVLPFKDMKDTLPTRKASHLMPILAPDVVARERLTETLHQGGIQTSNHYPMISDLSAFKAEHDSAATPVSKAFCEREISLPLYSSLEVDQVTKISEAMLNHCKD